MKKDTILTKPLKSSFYFYEKDVEKIIQKLFISSQPYSNELKRLLLINTKDCLDISNDKYNTIINNTSVKELIEQQYFTLVPKVKMEEHEELKSFIILQIEDVSTTTNPEYRDSVISFDIQCPIEYWNLGNYAMRPIKIAGIIDGILKDSKLSGIGELQFFDLKRSVWNENTAGYKLMFLATHGNDDKLPGV